MVDEKGGLFEKLLLKSLKMTKTELTLLQFMFGEPDGKFVTSVEITKGLGIAQSNISVASRKLIEFGWVESSPKGYRRVKTVEEIKADMIARYKEKAESIDKDN